MQKHLNKKGFTIVELVIVIAVIAILAAVLIPTFVSLINKANMSADQQAVTNMNKILSTSEKPTDIDGVIEILIENDYAGDLTTYYKNYRLAWVESENVIVLIENDTIVYPEKYVDKGLTFEFINPMATDAEALADGLTDGKTVYVADDIDVEEGLAPSEAGEYEVNLNGNTLSSSDCVGSWVEDAKLVVTNGIIDATSSDQTIAVYASENGIVELTNVQIYAASGVNPVQIYGGEMVLNNVTTSQTGEAETAWYNSAIQIANHIAQDENGKWYFDGGLSSVTVNSGMYSAKRAIQMSSPGGTVVINGGTFIGTEYALNADYHAPYAEQGATHSITINGGSFTGNIKVAKGVDCVVNGGTFSVDIGAVANVTISEGKTVVDNGNGTWTVK